ncbi:hypothetical protein EGR_10441 [Echinococcus granulosus]|uniref:Uncharacterized protein n=1 Tax=Echinococcus granulosus TaxID=6210 RepID=W6U2C4_ECHGR|nr:hypothetical protein EGR_10441 [Echinococcus granulosus]EUB54701.1 hypothetical protein EGR_10441 [Echinococcus granulosus]
MTTCRTSSRRTASRVRTRGGKKAPHSIQTHSFLILHDTTAPKAIPTAPIPMAVIQASNTQLSAGVALNRAVITFTVANSVSQSGGRPAYSLLTTGFSVFFGSSTAWMLGSTPPCAMVTPPNSLFNSSSLRIAKQKQVTRNDTRLLVVACRVTRQLQHLGSQVLEHSSQLPRRNRRCTRPTGNCRPARADLVFALARDLPPLPLPLIVLLAEQPTNRFKRDSIASLITLHISLARHRYRRLLLALIVSSLSHALTAASDLTASRLKKP